MDEGADDKQFIKVKDPLWYNEKWTRQVVKGNFMTIVARPKIVEDGEWLAHQGMLTMLYEIGSALVILPRLVYTNGIDVVLNALAMS